MWVPSLLRFQLTHSRCNYRRAPIDLIGQCAGHVAPIQVDAPVRARARRDRIQHRCAWNDRGDGDSNIHTIRNARSPVGIDGHHDEIVRAVHEADLCPPMVVKFPTSVTDPFRVVIGLE